MNLNIDLVVASDVRPSGGVGLTSDIGRQPLVRTDVRSFFFGKKQLTDQEKRGVVPDQLLRCSNWNYSSFFLIGQFLFSKKKRPDVSPDERLTVSYSGAVV
jgi:hypothetical protein